MGIRGLQSNAALAIAPVADLPRDARPEPPEEQAAEWCALVGSSCTPARYGVICSRNRRSAVW
jgi:hypothetical protein